MGSYLVLIYMAMGQHSIIAESEEAWRVSYNIIISLFSMHDKEVPAQINISMHMEA